MGDPRENRIRELEGIISLKRENRNAAINEKLNGTMQRLKEAMASQIELEEDQEHARSSLHRTLENEWQNYLNARIIQSAARANAGGQTININQTFNGGKVRIGKFGTMN